MLPITSGSRFSSGFRWASFISGCIFLHHRFQIKNDTQQQATRKVGFPATADRWYFFNRNLDHDFHWDDENSTLQEVRRLNSTQLVFSEHFDPSEVVCIY